MEEGVDVPVVGHEVRRELPGLVGGDGIQPHVLQRRYGDLLIHRKHAAEANVLLVAPAVLLQDRTRAVVHNLGAAGGRRIAADQLGHREAGGDAPIGHLNHLVILQGQAYWGLAQQDVPIIDHYLVIAGRGRVVQQLVPAFRRGVEGRGKGTRQPNQHILSRLDAVEGHVMVEIQGEGVGLAEGGEPQRVAQRGHHRVGLRDPENHGHKGHVDRAEERERDEAPLLGLVIRVEVLKVQVLLVVAAEPKDLLRPGHLALPQLRELVHRALLCRLPLFLLVLEAPAGIIEGGQDDGAAEVLQDEEEQDHEGEVEKEAGEREGLPQLLHHIQPPKDHLREGDGAVWDGGEIPHGLAKKQIAPDHKAKEDVAEDDHQKEDRRDGPADGIHQHRDAGDLIAEVLHKGAEEKDHHEARGQDEIAPGHRLLLEDGDVWSEAVRARGREALGEL
mmetsp:Transcript_33227/g.79574  ORF Transcript_33227/g.79574 Transcript_33227/m.79574 type:complete len:446 (-) Transcript_33227:1633-2970(-)